MDRSVVVKVVLYLCALPGLQNPPELLLRPISATRSHRTPPPRIVIRIAEAGPSAQRIAIVAVVAVVAVDGPVDGLVAAVVGGAVAVDVVVLPAAPLLAAGPAQVQQHTYLRTALLLLAQVLFPGNFLAWYLLLTKCPNETPVPFVLLLYK